MEKDLTLHEKLKEIQVSFSCPKNRFNKFGGFSYRSLDDITEAIKPYLKKFSLTLSLSDEIVMFGDRFYVKATATISNGQSSLSTFAFAREQVTKKGMDEAQVTGAASSYARKYALNGLLGIDDNQDIDAREELPKNMDNVPEKKPASKQESQSDLIRKIIQEVQKGAAKLNQNPKIYFQEATGYSSGEHLKSLEIKTLKEVLRAVESFSNF